VTVVITGIGLRSCLGNLKTTWEQLLQGKTGIKPQQPFTLFPPLPLGLIGTKPLSLNTLTAQIISDLLTDTHLIPPLPNCGVVIGSSRAHQGELEALLRGEKTNPWLEILPSQPAQQIARTLGSCAPVLAPMAACATGIWALYQAYALIQGGYCEQVVAGAVEAPITPLTLAGFQQLGAIASTGCYPFDVAREGLVLGEGGAFFLLESLPCAQQRQALIYAQIRGFGFSGDAHHLSAPEPSNRSARKAVRDCLARACLYPEKIDYIHAHGTSTRLNDQREAALITELFPQGVGVSSTKGATGHTLGASGVFGVALSCLALQEQILPPCVGLKNPQFPLDLVREGRKQQVKNILGLCFGFGGQNGAVILGL
jgi:3-oxoacyl-[acyl-carrier-protein] synthase II